MRTMNESESAIEDIAEAPTGEYPVLKQGGPPPDHLNGKEHFVIDSEKAAFWLTHLESEVNRLHEKWHSIDAEFKTREAHIAELRDEVKDRDADIAKLTADLSSGAEALKAAEEKIASGEADIARLIAEAKVRDGKVDELAAALGGAADRHGALQKTLDSTLVEVARLNASVREEQGPPQASQSTTKSCSPISGAFRSNFRISRSTSTAGTRTGPSSTHS